MSSQRAVAQTHNTDLKVPKGCAGGRAERENRKGSCVPGERARGHGLLLEHRGRASPACLMAVLLDLGQGLKQHVPRGQQDAVVKKQEQLPQRMEQLVQGVRELGL